MKRIVQILFVLLIFSLGIILSSLNGIAPNYYDGEEIIEYNWDITLPDGGKELYYITGEPSFHGDGPRFSVYEYDNEEIIRSSFTWEDKKNTDMEEEIHNVLKMLGEYNDVSEQYIPDFKKEYKYVTKSKEDNSQLYLVYINRENRIYVIEYFL